MKSSTIAIIAFAYAAALAPFACADNNELLGENPPGGAGGYDPGDGGPGNTTGTYMQGSGGGSGPPMCDDSLKRCDHLFTYQDMGETSVELRGDFAPDAWNTGVPMSKSGGTWSATAQIPYNTDVLYKLVLNGNTWSTDPTNPDKVDNGLGDFNSRLAGATCDMYTCAPPLKGDFDWRDAVLYFVFVDRFVNGDKSNDGATTSGVQPAADYQGGDWAGVLQKIQ